MPQAFLGDEEKTNIIVHPMTEMFDESTLVTDVALVKKCLEALDERVIALPNKKIQTSARLATQNLV